MLKLYENIKTLRKQNHWTQEELALRMNYTDRSTIAKIEAGKVDLSQSKIVEFANVFGVEPGELMGWEDTPDEKTPHERLVGAYVKNDFDRKLLERYHNLSPEARKLIDLVIEDDLRKNGRPD